MQFAAGLVGILWLATKSAAIVEVGGEGEAQCTGSACSDESVRVSSLLQKTRSQVASAVIQEDPMTEEMAAEMVMQELEQAGAKDAMSVRSSMAATKQMLALDEAEARAAVDDGSAQVEESTAALPFAVPFDTSKYKGHEMLTSTEGGITTGAVGYYGIDSDFIYLGMASNCGFVGFGLNAKSPSMRNADIVICREYKAGSGTISAQDFFARHNSMPQADDKEDWETEKSGRVQSGGRAVSWCQIRRRRETCELTKDYQAFEDGTTLFGLLAYSQPAAVNDELAYHGPTQKRIFTFSLNGAGGKPPGVPAGAKVMKIASPTVNVPTIAGSYMCSYHVLPLPDRNKNYHVIQWRAIWNKQSKAYKAGVQHHVDLNACAQAIPGARNGQNIPCDRAMAYCSETFLTGINQYSPKGEVLDADAGIAVGKSDTVYVLMSRHFYNPSRRGGITDGNCQFHITYTDQLRPNNFLMLLITTTHIKVPANNLDYNSPAICPAECTQRLLGMTEIRHVGFHLHGAGLRAKLRLVRDGHELEPIGTTIPWDDSQANIRIKRYVAPGDHLVMECHYTNGGKRPIPYGESLTDEMCVATMSIVGPGSLKMCADLPWGAQKIPSSCYYKKGGKTKVKSWPHCKKGVPMTYCPDNNNMAGKGQPTKITAASHNLKFKELKAGKAEKCKVNKGTYVPPVAGSCKAPPIYSAPAKGAQAIPRSVRSDESNNDKTAKPPGPGQIAGEEDIIDDGGQTFKVSWLTDCNKKTVTFAVQCNGNAAWLALGLIDGGTADTPKMKPPSSMSAVDVVQVNPRGHGLKDGWGSGYKPPDPKGKPVARFVKAEIKNGKSYMEFERPFVSPDGVSLTENGFVFLVGAVNFAGGAAFDAKHNLARPRMVRVSLFGGHPDYYKSEDGKAQKSNPEPEPEAEPEVELKSSGHCKAKVQKISDCWASAANKGIMFRASKTIKNKNFAFGCLWNQNGKSKAVLFNREKTNVACKAGFQCLCRTTYPEPEPEPEPEGTEPYLLKSGKCAAAEMEPVEECAAKAAEALASGKIEKLRQFKNTKWPAGCFVNQKGIPFFNKFTDSMISCGRSGSKGCVCEGPKKPKTKAKAVVYKTFVKTSGTCAPGENVITEDECEQAVKDLKLKVTAPYVRFRNFGFPPGCIWWQNRRAAFNRNTGLDGNAKAKGTFNDKTKRVGICKGTYTKSKKLCDNGLDKMEQCKDAANALKLQWGEAKELPENLRPKWPTGCFWFNNRVWLNPAKSGTANDCFKGECLCKD